MQLDRVRHCRQSCQICSSLCLGNRAEGTGFAELINSMDGPIPSITKVQKLRHIFSCLKGEPQGLVRHIPVIDENCNLVWDLLEKRYKIEVNINYLKALDFPVNKCDFRYEILLGKIDQPLRKAF
ncbi:hypothetical protein PR048_017819 [Dryococelus australis]|uniref:Uncharacterized protein n=1 Tax=Dryococelus australis TaxID=614101 RepID=A0ABQ9HAI8_9NEOP|nr:hypothetical protein PR048_017819 [Dryococelus australis]